MEVSEQNIDEAYNTLKSHFRSKDAFLTQLERLGDQQEKFIRLTLLYQTLLKESHLPLVDEDLLLGFINDSFKFISLMSLIEALYSEKEYKTFFEWLVNKDQRDYYPINDYSDIEEIYQKYKTDHGSIKKIVHFFNDIPKNYKWILAEDFELYTIKKTKNRPDEVEQDPPDFEEIAKTLYKIRSNFVHNGKIITNISGTPCLSKFDNQLVISKLTIDSLGLIYETVLLAMFGFKDQENTS
jgi:hypothetical protein